MEACTHIVSSAESPTFFESVYNLIGLGQRFYSVSEFRMCFKWQNLAVDAKGFYTIKPTKFKCLEKRICIVQANTGNIIHPLVRR